MKKELEVGQRFVVVSRSFVIKGQDHFTRCYGVEYDDGSVGQLPRDFITDWCIEKPKNGI